MQFWCQIRAISIAKLEPLEFFYIKKQVIVRRKYCDVYFLLLSLPIILMIRKFTFSRELKILYTGQSSMSMRRKTFAKENEPRLPLIRGLIEGIKNEASPRKLESTSIAFLSRLKRDAEARRDINSPASHRTNVIITFCNSLEEF